MTKDDYLFIFREYLTGMTEEEKDDAVRFYAEQFAEAGEELEAQVMLDLGAPYELAKKVSASSFGNDVYVDRHIRKKSGWTAKKIIGLVVIAVMLSCIIGVLYFHGKGLLGAVGKSVSVGYDVYEFSGDVATFSNVDIEVSNCSIEFVYGNSYGVEVKLKIPKGTKMETRVDKSTLVIHQPSGNILTGFGMKEYNSSIKITLPSAEYGSFNVVTSNAHIDLEINGSRIKNIDFKTSNGYVFVGGVTSDEVLIKTSNSGLNLDHTNIGYCKAETSNGNVGVEHAEGASMSLKSSNGAVTCNWLNMTDSVNIETSNGEVFMSTDIKSSKFTVTGQTSNGNILIGDEKKGKEVTYGSGYIKINVKTSNNNAQVWFNNQ